MDINQLSRLHRYIQPLVNFAGERGYWVKYGVKRRELADPYELPSILSVKCGPWDRNEHQSFSSIEAAKRWIEESFAKNGHGGHRPEDYEDDRAGHGMYDLTGIDYE